MIWLDANSPAVRAAVVSGVWGRAPHSEHAHPVLEEPDDIDIITASLQVASDILTPLTAYRIHPAGIAVEDFTATSRAHRLTPNYTPIRRVVSLERVLEDSIEAVTETWQLQNNHVKFDTRVLGPLGLICGQARQQERLRLTYQFGSTITGSARRAVLWLAHQFWLEADGCEDCGECQLPGRTTAVQREGLSYTLLDPQDYLRDGKTGVPTVDLWISSVNPKRALRPSAVHTPDAPPPENVSIRSLRPVWS